MQNSEFRKHPAVYASAWTDQVHSSQAEKRFCEIVPGLTALAEQTHTVAASQLCQEFRASGPSQFRFRVARPVKGVARVHDRRRIHALLGRATPNASQLSQEVRASDRFSFGPLRGHL